MLWALMSWSLLLVHTAKTACPRYCSCKQQNLDCSNKQLTTISNDLLLEFFQAGAVRDPSLINVKTITELNLANNQLKELPTQLLSESLPNLLSIDLSNNRILDITSIQGVVLSKRLLSLRVSSNPIHHLGNNTDTVLYSQSISHLDLSKCDINSITHPETFMFMLNLTTVDLSENPLVVVDHLVSNTLRHLDLSQCLLGYIDKGIRDESLVNLPYLQFLNISENAHLTRLPVSKLSNTLLDLDASYCALEKLDLRPFPNLQNAVLKGNIIKILHNNVLFDNVYLQSLDISENSIYHVERYAFVGCRSLKKLDLSKNLLSDFDWSTLTETPQLSIVNISRNLLTTLNELPMLSLTTMDVSKCDISTVNHHALEKAVNIKYLNLSHNSLEHVPKGLITTKLLSLDLSFCRISDFEEGPYTEQSNLVNLNLMGNRISSPLKKNVFSHLPYLKELNLLNNPWHCDCNDPDFESLWKYLINHPSKSKHAKKLLCQSPKEYNGMSWERICFSHLSANEDAFTKNKTLFSVVIPFLTMACLLAILFVIRQAYFSHQMEHQQRDTRRSGSNQNENRRFPPRTAPHLMDEDLERGIQMSINESSQRVHLRELSKLPSYEEALLLPKPQSREDLQKIVKKYEETDRFERPFREDSQTESQIEHSLNHPGTSSL